MILPSPSTLISRPSSILTISSLGRSIPRTWLILSTRTSMTLAFTGFGYTSTLPSQTLPAPISSMSLQTLSAAASVRFGSMPFSNLAEASVLRPSLLAVVLMLSPLKLADSTMIVCVSSSISEFSPPMTPAIAMLLSASLIMSMSSSIFLSVSSRVVKTSPGAALSTMILLPWTSLMSNA